MNNITSYCIELTPGQLDYLAGSKYGIDRMKILHCLISAVVLKETIYSIKGFTTTLQAGQGIMSEVDLSNRLHYDKKTISRVLDRMNELGIVATTQSNRTSVHSLKCVSAWIVGGSLVANPFHVHTSSHPLPIDDSDNTDSNNHSLPSAIAGTKKGNTSSQNIPTCKKAKARNDEDCFSLFPLFDAEPPIFSDDGELLQAPSPSNPEGTSSRQERKNNQEEPPSGDVDGNDTKGSCISDCSPRPAAMEGDETASHTF